MVTSWLPTFFFLGASAARAQRVRCVVGRAPYHECIHAGWEGARDLNLLYYYAPAPVRPATIRTSRRVWRGGAWKKGGH